MEELEVWRTPLVLDAIHTTSTTSHPHYSYRGRASWETNSPGSDYTRQTEALPVPAILSLPLQVQVQSDQPHNDSQQLSNDRDCPLTAGTLQIRSLSSQLLEPDLGNNNNWVLIFLQIAWAEEINSRIISTSQTTSGWRLETLAQTRNRKYCLNIFSVNHRCCWWRSY